jgi:hypothetical protein
VRLRPIGRRLTDRGLLAKPSFSLVRAVTLPALGIALATLAIRASAADVVETARGLEPETLPASVIPTPFSDETKASPFAIAAPAFSPATPASRGGAQILAVLERIRSEVRTTRYQHNTVVKEAEGLFAWDCSAMVAWVLERAAPRAREGVGGGRPLARDFYRAIEGGGLNAPRRGWLRLRSIAEARPGDVFAWLRPPDWPARNTGHVGFVISEPLPVAAIPGAYAMRVVDATSLPHQDDTRGSGGEGGFGEGTLLFLTDGVGGATAYGWFGTNSAALVVTKVLFGRI